MYVLIKVFICFDFWVLNVEMGLFFVWKIMFVFMRFVGLYSGWDFILWLLV